MSAFDFISHESYPEDKFICESVVICIENKYRVVYIRKIMQNGGKFWDEISAAVVTQNAEKKYLKAWKADSNFLRDDILTFLDNRSWEKGKGGSIALKEDKSDNLPF
jgi:hypothetical protein